MCLPFNLPSPTSPHGARSCTVIEDLFECMNDGHSSTLPKKLTLSFIWCCVSFLFWTVCVLTLFDWSVYKANTRKTTKKNSWTNMKVSCMCFGFILPTHYVFKRHTRKHISTHNKGRKIHEKKKIFKAKWEFLFSKRFFHSGEPRSAFHFNTEREELFTKKLSVCNKTTWNIFWLISFSANIYSAAHKTGERNSKSDIAEISSNSFFILFYSNVSVYLKWKRNEKNSPFRKVKLNVTMDGMNDLLLKHIRERIS